MNAFNNDVTGDLEIAMYVGFTRLDGRHMAKKVVLLTDRHIYRTTAIEIGATFKELNSGLTSNDLYITFTPNPIDLNDEIEARVESARIANAPKKVMSNPELPYSAKAVRHSKVVDDFKDC